MIIKQAETLLGYAIVDRFDNGYGPRWTFATYDLMPNDTLELTHSATYEAPSPALEAFQAYFADQN
jgi:hypothetical protein